MTISMSARQRMVCAVLLCSAWSCREQTTEVSAASHMEIVSISIANDSVQPGDSLHLAVMARDTIVRSKAHAIVLTTASDSESVTVYPTVCIYKGRRIQCGLVSIVVDAGRSPTEFLDVITSLGGTLSVLASGNTGFVMVPPGDEVHARSVLSKVRGIYAAELFGIISMRPPRGVPPRAEEGAAWIRISSATPRRGDGVLQAYAGTTVHVSSASNPAIAATFTVR